MLNEFFDKNRSTKFGFSDIRKSYGGRIGILQIYALKYSIAILQLSLSLSLSLSLIEKSNTDIIV
jgi:hypothetical protein